MYPRDEALSAYKRSATHSHTVFGSVHDASTEPHHKMAANCIGSQPETPTITTTTTTTTAAGATAAAPPPQPIDCTVGVSVPTNFNTHQRDHAQDSDPEHALRLMLPDSSNALASMSSPHFSQNQSSHVNSAFNLDHSSSAAQFSPTVPASLAEAPVAQSSSYYPPSSAFAFSPPPCLPMHHLFGPPSSATFSQPLSATFAPQSATLSAQTHSTPLLTPFSSAHQTLPHHPTTPTYPQRSPTSTAVNHYHHLHHHHQPAAATAAAATATTTQSTNVGVVDEAAADALFAAVPRKQRDPFTRVTTSPSPLDFASSSSPDYFPPLQSATYPQPLSLPSPSLILPPVSPPAAHRPISTPNSAAPVFPPTLSPPAKTDAQSTGRASSIFGPPSFAVAPGYPNNTGTISSNFSSSASGNVLTLPLPNASAVSHLTAAKAPSPPPLALPFGLSGASGGTAGAIAGQSGSHLPSPPTLPLPLSTNLPPTVPTPSFGRSTLSNAFGLAQSSKREPDQLPSPSLLMQSSLLSPSLCFGSAPRLDDVPASSIFSPPPHSNPLPSLHGPTSIGTGSGSSICLREEQPGLFQAFSQPLPSPFGPSSSAGLSGVVAGLASKRDSDAPAFHPQQPRNDFVRSQRAATFGSDVSSFQDTQAHYQPQYSVQQTSQQAFGRQAPAWSFAQTHDPPRSRVQQGDQQMHQQHAFGASQFDANSSVSTGLHIREHVQSHMEVQDPFSSPEKTGKALHQVPARELLNANSTPSLGNNSSNSTAEGVSAAVDVSSSVNVSSGDSDSLRCDQCGNRFARKSNLLKHKRSVHATVRKHVCSFCKFAFKRYDHLSKHSTFFSSSFSSLFSLPSAFGYIEIVFSVLCCCWIADKSRCVLCVFRYVNCRSRLFRYVMTFVNY